MAPMARRALRVLAQLRALSAEAGVDTLSAAGPGPSSSCMSMSRSFSRALTSDRGIIGVQQPRSALQCHGQRISGPPTNGCGHAFGPENRSVQTAAQQQAEDPLIAASSLKLFDSDSRAHLTPAAIVDLLEKYIVGQRDAKRAVAVALRNRWRRSQLPSDAADEIMPKNILMIGPTGCGKTEIARRLAKLVDAPFIKVEATKYTELGYVGKDVEDIIKDLVEAAQTLVRQRARERLRAQTAERTENIILAALAGPHADAETLSTMRDLYREGLLDERSVQVEVPPAGGDGARKLDMQNGFIMIEQIMRGDKMGGRRGAEKRKMTVGEARARLEEVEAEKMLASDQITREAIRAAEQDGIVFIDEIDKIVGGGSGRHTGGNVSNEGVQRDLLPIIEGSTVQTKYGNVNTDHILFVCSGAFHQSKPSDMLAELQGRLPIRVELKGLTADDFYRILTEPQNNMIKQQQVLLATEGVELEFTEAAIRACSTVAEEANRMLDNIGARRLHTVLERVLADISYTAPERSAEARSAGQEKFKYVVDEEHVMACMGSLLKKQDLSKYVL